MPAKIPYQKAPKVLVAPDGMRATLRVLSPISNEEEPNFTASQLEGFLNSAGVVYGINMDRLKELEARMEYDRDHEIAVGVPAENGENGFYEYHFSQDFSNKPVIREDGSADFLSIKIMEVVYENDLIATYHPAVPGTDGMSVKGKVVAPKIVRDLPPLGGRGFRRDDDEVHYYSDIDGKIVLTNNRIIISPVYEIAGDADMSVGNIEFKGDVIIHGGVKHGIAIHATGTVTVDGLVELCDISAGKDIYLKSGVKGSERTCIYAEGNITAEFIEYANVSCKGSLRADVIFNCNVNCESKVIATDGKRSAIIGGNIIGVLGVSALNLGNKFGVITDICVGVDADRMMELATLKKRVESLENDIRKIKKGVEAFDAANAGNGTAYIEDPRRMQLVRIKIQDEAELAQDKVRLEELETMFEVGKKSTVKAYKTVFAGVNIHSSGNKVQMSDYQRQVEFVRTETGIRMEPLEDMILE